MDKRSKYLACFLVAVFFIAGCTTVPVKKELIFNALVLDNKSGSDLEYVRIEARNTGAFASCGVILRGTSCSTTFRTRTYQGNSVYITWVKDGQDQLVGTLFVEQSETINYEMAARIVIMFNSDNDVTAKFMY
ncbi:MAG: hypothetical protein GQ547_05740 [Methylophaga sp.]|nr:hypothetical protein [Methylophaga sp.]